MLTGHEYNVHSTSLSASEPANSKISATYCCSVSHHLFSKYIDYKLSFNVNLCDIHFHVKALLIAPLVYV